jgi:hypothetical protein
MIERRQRLSRYARPPDISGWVLVGGLAGLIVVVVLFTRDGCDNDFAALLRLRMVSVDTWAEWREHLAGTDLYLKYRAFTVRYEPDSIRSDFLRRALIDLPFVRSLNTARLWNEGTTLHVGGLTTDLQFQDAANFFEHVMKHEWVNLPQDEYFIHATIASLFQEVVLHGPNDRTSRISLPFLYGE